MNSVTVPAKVFAIPGRTVEDKLKLAEPFRRADQLEDIFDIGA